MLASIYDTIDRLLWHSRTDEPRALFWLRRAARYPYAIARDALEGQLTMRAMSLVYTTLLSIVPLIALVFSILKAFDVHYHVEPLLLHFLNPLGSDQAVELTSKVIEFVENTREVTFGTISLLVLLYTVISMVQKVEESVNYVWQVERTRSLARRFSEYLSILLIAPVLMFSAITVRGAVASNTLLEKLQSNPLVSESAILMTRVMPFAAVTAVFTFIYVLVPNTRVHVRAALVGGLFASLMWNGVGAAFASFVSGSSNYTAIYTTFAAVIIALIWLYANWLILLVGAKISFYFQNPEYLRYGHRPVRLSHADQESIAVEMMTEVAGAFQRGNPAHRINDLAAQMGLPGRAIGPIAQRLEDAGLLIITDRDLMLPGRALETISLNHVLDAARGAANARSPYRRVRKSVAATLEKMDQARCDTVRDTLLTDLVEPSRDAGKSVSGNRH